MDCMHCHLHKIALKPTCQGLEVCCPGCGHVYQPEEFQVLLRRRSGALPGTSGGKGRKKDNP